MAGFRLYTGNRLEKLVDRLSEIVEKPLSSIFKSEIIVVQSKGMERWLSMELAKRFGVWSNCRFPFPDRFIWDIFRIFLENLPDIKDLSPDVIAWKIMRLLPEAALEPEFADINSYLGEDKNQLKVFQLSERIADTFDRYTIYRPEMIIEWENDKEKNWQPILWRRLTRGDKTGNRAHIRWLFFNAIKNGGFDTGSLPERVSIFGIPSLPDYHLKIIQALSTLIDVHFFLMCPTKEYWGDIVPAKKISDLTNHDYHFETGNPLLASMGKLGRDFFNAIYDCDPEDYQLFEEPDRDSLLSFIQSDIFNMLWRGKDIEKTGISDDDISVQVHSCHSPMREIEVLFDNLLFLFERYRGLEPKDIIIMTPDIETYAPYISAVFDSYQDEKKRIPYSIADRGASTESPVINIFLKIIKLCKSRFYASDVIDVIDAPSVQERFKLKREDIDLIIRWVNDTQIRWGIDEKHRDGLGLPPFKGNSWRTGIERLLLGYSMFSKDELFNGILPYDDMEGNETEILGYLLDFLTSLFSYTDKFGSAHQLDEWAEILDRMLVDFIAVNEDSERDVQFIRTEIRGLKLLQEETDIHEPVTSDVILYYLTKKLSIKGLFPGFITGGVTFCEMRPMRSIPFKVVALIGMNNDAYPREHKPIGFDLTVHNPKPGDHSLRDEDRYLFLEAILSARLCLYISYTGQSIRDNSEIPPSVLVSELLDYIEKGFYKPGCNIMDYIVRKQRLQAFSPMYFTEGLLFSYSEEDCDALRARMEKETLSQKTFIVQPLKAITDEWKDITTTELKQFFKNPSKYFLNNRLGIYLDEDQYAPEDDEPFELNDLDAFNIRTNLAKRMLDGFEIERYSETILAKGVLPPESPGRVVLKSASVETKTFSDKVKQYLTGPIQPIDFEIEKAGFKIKGRLDAIYQAGMVGYRFIKKTGAKHLLEVWIDHLFLNIAGKKDYPKRSVFITSGDTHSFKPVDNGEAILKEMLELYMEGLKMPLVFFPKTSMTYVEQLKKGKKYMDAISSAIRQWIGSDNQNGESLDPYYSLCFGDADIFDEKFMENAMAIFEPIIEHIEI